MGSIKFDYSGALSFVNQHEIDYMAEYIKSAHDMLHNGTGAGNDFLGWIDLPVNYDKEEFDRIKKAAEKIRNDSDVLIVIGIGGSYLGARAAVEMLQHSFYNALDKDKRKGPAVFFAGNSISSTYMAELLEAIDGKDLSVNVISKSGTTTETSISFRIFKQYIEKKYGKKEAARRIIATTDAHKGTLKALADKEGYAEFVVPDDIGGRFSVFTAVGLVPLALAGIDIKALMEGSKKAMEDYSKESIEENDAYKYAVARRILDDKGYSAEMFVTYNLQLQMVAEWWKQLFGESEGKDGKGILPTSGCFSTDLHSLGQFVQEGRKCLYETLLLVDEMPGDMLFPEDEENLDNMNYLAGKSISWVNEQAQKGTLKAHSDNGNVPNIEIHLKDNSAYSFGYMIYFFMRACGMSCYLLGINPFNQPGVEVYKKEMFKLLGKE